MTNQLPISYYDGDERKFVKRDIPIESVLYVQAKDRNHIVHVANKDVTSTLVTELAMYRIADRFPDEMIQVRKGLVIAKKAIEYIDGDKIKLLTVDKTFTIPRRTMQAGGIKL